MATVQLKANALGSRGITLRRPGLGLGAAASGAALAVLTADALVQPRAPFDLPVEQAVQRLDAPGLAAAVQWVDTLTGSTGAIMAWATAIALFALARWWLPALGMLLLPFGGVANEGIGMLVGRERPHVPELTRTSLNFVERSYPSGHVCGTVLFYGYLFFLAGYVRPRPLRLLLRLAFVALVAFDGLARIWSGAHWPSDVLAAYALGGLLLCGLVALHRTVERAWGDLPLVAAGPVPHDPRLHAAHALTSLVVFDGAEVDKVYNPGLLPRILYWLAFQAPFPYDANHDALVAALHRRNLAALLTAYWYGRPHVAAALRVTSLEGRPALVSERVVGEAPEDRAAARSFLADLKRRFAAVGLPTWQIDPRQPRATDNVLQTAEGRLVVVDLESGLATPPITRAGWRLAFRRGAFPSYDDVDFAAVGAYVEREAPGIAGALGESGLAELRATLAAAEAADARWRSSEPRVWGRSLRRLCHALDPHAWLASFRAMTARGGEHAAAWLDGAVGSWEAEQRLTPSEAARLRARIADPAFQAALPPLGAQILVSVPLRFPLGSIVRPLMVLGALAVAGWRRLRGRIDHDAWVLARRVHSPLVVVLSTLPFLGAFAYLACAPIRSERLLLRAGADAALRKAPWCMYRRSRLDRWLAPPVSPSSSGRLVTPSEAGPALQMDR